MVTRKKVSFYAKKPMKVPKKVKINGKTFYVKGMPKKDKTNFRVVFLVILAYFAGVINFNLGLIEMIVDIIIIIFVVDTLMKKPKKKKKKLKHCRFWKVCKLYNKEHKPCNEDEGFYGSNYAGCYNNLVKIEEENKKKKKRKWKMKK